MPTHLLTPATYTPAVPWTHGPGELSTLPAAAGPGPWLRVFAFAPAIPEDETVVGIEVILHCWTDDAAAVGGNPMLTSQWSGGGVTGGGGGLGDVETTGGITVIDPSSVGSIVVAQKKPLEVALSVDGVNPIGDKWVFFPIQAETVVTIGSPAYAFNKPGGWAPAEFGIISLLVRRPTGTTAVSSQYVTTARVRVTTTTPEENEPTMYGQELTEIVLLGPETTPGTLATAFTRLRALNYKARPNVTTKKHRPTGEKMNAFVIPLRDYSMGTFNGVLDYNEFPVICEAVIGTGSHSGTGVALQRNKHVYTLENRKRSLYKTFSIQRGDDVLARQHLNLIHNSIEVAINTQDVSVSGGFFADKMTPGITMAAGVTEVQSITVTGVPAGGTFRLAFKGAETTDLAFNASAAAIQTALRLLDTIAGANINIAGGGPFTATFAGTLAGLNQPLITLANNALTGGTTPSVTITETTRGGYTEYPLTPVQVGHWNIYMSDTQAGLDAGKIDKSTGVAATGFAIADRLNPVFVLDRDVAGSIAGGVEMDPKFTANLLVGANTTGMSLLTTLRAAATKWLRLEAVGPVIGATTDHYKMIWEGPVKVDETTQDFGNEDGRVVYPWNFEWTEGANGEVPTLTVENGVITY